MLVEVFDKSFSLVHTKKVKYATVWNFKEYQIRRGKADSPIVKAYNAGLPIIVSGEDVFEGVQLVQDIPSLHLDKWANWEKGSPEWMSGLQQAVDILGEKGVVNIHFNYEGRQMTHIAATTFADQLRGRGVPVVPHLHGNYGFTLYLSSHPYVLAKQKMG